MGFRENLKSQLEYSGMLVKELAARSKIKKKTIDSYLGNKAYSPSIENAVSIAKALGVSIDYLATGKNYEKTIPLSSLPADIQEIIAVLKQLNPRDRNIILSLARILKDK
jgi:transcriptional regulator with XRE-family HTH domain